LRALHVCLQLLRLFHEVADVAFMGTPEKVME
jgi:hypothetical protein